MNAQKGPYSFTFLTLPGTITFARNNLFFFMPLNSRNPQAAVEHSSRVSEEEDELEVLRRVELVEEFDVGRDRSHSDCFDRFDGLGIANTVCCLN